VKTVMLLHAPLYRQALKESFFTKNTPKCDWQISKQWAKAVGNSVNINGSRPPRAGWKFYIKDCPKNESLPLCLKGP